MQSTTAPTSKVRLFRAPVRKQRLQMTKVHLSPILTFKTSPILVELNAVVFPLHAFRTRMIIGKEMFVDDAAVPGRRINGDVMPDVIVTEAEAAVVRALHGKLLEFKNQLISHF